MCKVAVVELNIKYLYEVVVGVVVLKSSSESFSRNTY